LWLGIAIGYLPWQWKKHFYSLLKNVDFPMPDLMVYLFADHWLYSVIIRIACWIVSPYVFLIGFPGLIGWVCWWHDCHHLLMMYPIYFLRYDSEIELRFMSGTTI
jgi:hypothetical protein